ncbi:unnamed protein product [Lota lota]
MIKGSVQIKLTCHWEEEFQFQKSSPDTYSPQREGHDSGTEVHGAIQLVSIAQNVVIWLPVSEAGFERSAEMREKGVMLGSSCPTSEARCWVCSAGQEAPTPPAPVMDYQGLLGPGMIAVTRGDDSEVGDDYERKSHVGEVHVGGALQGLQETARPPVAVETEPALKAVQSSGRTRLALQNSLAFGPGGVQEGTQLAIAHQLCPVL